MKPGYLLHNRYSIQRPLAAGYFCVTYLATDCEYYRPKYVIVKHLRPQSKSIELLQIARRLFETEAVTLKKLGDLTDRIPTLEAYFEEQREFYIVQEFIEGQTLAREISNRKLSTLETIQVLREILIGLQFVHAENTIHRDLKPDNIIRRSSDRALVLIDFGGVKEVSNTTLTMPNPKTLASIGFGTEGYMPSEQAMGYPKLASDIYAVGAIGIECLTGIEPYELFDENSLDFKWQHLSQSIDTQSDPLIKPLISVLNKMLQQRYADRYYNATEALTAINSIEKQSIHRLNLSPRTSSSLIKNGAFTPIDRVAFIKLMALGGFIATSSWVISQFTQSVESQSHSRQFTKIGSIDQLKTVPITSIKLNERGDIIDRPKSTIQIFQEELSRGVFLTMVKILAGEFMMGSSTKEQGRERYESPQHLVKIPEFYLGQTHVTQAQWAAILPDKASKANRSSQLPVNNVSWLDAIEFCERLSQKTGYRYRLPTEAEWEYACRARSTNPFAYGDTISSGIVNHNADYPYSKAARGLYREQITPVAIFPPNFFGLHEMHGNLWEWCLDEWFPDYHGAPTDGSARGDVQLPDEESRERLRVVRGGSWASYASTCRAASRSSLFAWFRHHHYGFRVVCTGERVTVKR